MTTKADQLWKSIEDAEMRREFNVDVDTGLAFQIRALREKNGWTQQQLAERTGSKQETICQWENPNYGRYTLTTLKGLATAFDVGLMVKFAPFSEVVEWNANLTRERLAPPSFTEENLTRRGVAGFFSESALVLASAEPLDAIVIAEASPVMALAFDPSEGTYVDLSGPRREESPTHAIAA